MLTDVARFDVAAVLPFVATDSTLLLVPAGRSAPGVHLRDAVACLVDARTSHDGANIGESTQKVVPREE